MNRSGYIFAGILVMYFLMDIKRITIGKSEFILLMYGLCYFFFYTYHFSIGINEIIWYLVGPVGAFLIGKIFVRRSKNENAFITLVITLAFGMFVHGFLNWYAYRVSHYATQYSYLRLSVDFWRRELVRVTSTGMLFNFSAAICVGLCFSNIKMKYKAVAAAVLGICIALSAVFANRTIIFIVLILVMLELLQGMKTRHLVSKRTVVMVASILTLVMVGCAVLFSDLGKLFLEELLDIKIVYRLQTSDDLDPRFYAWIYFFRNFQFLKYPIGGDMLLGGGMYLPDGTKISYFHNLWLDVYNTAGIFPTILLIMFSARMFAQYRKFKDYGHKVGADELVHVMRCWIIGVTLNCFVEPIIEGNPYYFLMILMYFGAMEAQIGKWSMIPKTTEYE